MVEFCIKCNKRHSSDTWRSTWDPIHKVTHYCNDHFTPSAPEFIPQSMKDDRRANEKSMIQPWRSGEPSAEYIKAYPESAKKMFTLKERMKAKDVWKGDVLHSDWEKTQ
jgi:hypothetical protein